jgi:hypothetical protein
MRTNFTIRIYQDRVNNPVLSYLSDITISGITILSKPSKFEDICMHKSNQSKFKYSIALSKRFNKISGSHTSFNLSFKGDYIDIIINNFPRYPSFYQCKYSANNALNGYVGELNSGFPHQLLYREIKFLKND